jgi:hypothetical protein
MAAAVRLRADGKTLREIGKELAVDASTVLRDLRRWDAQQAELPSNVLQMRVASCPQRGELQQPDATDFATPLPAVASLNGRRK